MKENKRIERVIGVARPGDLVSVHWTDAHIGKSSQTGRNLDIPVETWGVFVGLLGGKRKHIVIAQNNFKFADGFFDVDYTSIPAGWATNMVIIVGAFVDPATTQGLINSFVMERDIRIFRERKTHQRRLSTHGA